MKRRKFVQSCLAAPLLLAGCQNAESVQADAESSNDVADRNQKREKTKSPTNNRQDDNMYGIIGKMNATEGNRGKLIDILLDGTKEMPGCKLYAISADSEDANAIWITEIWDSAESHQASLQLPAVQNAIAEGKPFIAGFGDRHVVTPIGGLGVT